MHVRIKIWALCALCTLFFSTLVLLAATIGSDTAVTRFNTQQTLNNGDRIAGFAGIYGGFALANSNTIGTLDTFFSVYGPIDLRSGTLILNQDFICNDNLYFNTIGNIIGQGHVLELDCSTTLIPITSGRCVTWGNVCLELNSDITLNNCITFTGSSGIDGRGHSINMTSNGQILLGQNSTLLMENLTIKGVHGSVIGAYDNSSTFSFSNVTWIMDGRYTFTRGKFDIIGDFTLSGSGGTFAYQTQGTSNIYGSGGNLFLDSGTILSYEPVTSSRTLLQMVSSSALLTMNGATLHSTTTGLQLTTGILVVDRTSYIASDGGIAAQAISFGNGINSGSNLNVEILPAATLNVLSGCLVLNDA